MAASTASPPCPSPAKADSSILRSLLSTRPSTPIRQGSLIDEIENQIISKDCTEEAPEIIDVEDTSDHDSVKLVAGEDVPNSKKRSLESDEKTDPKHSKNNEEVEDTSSGQDNRPDTPVPAASSPSSLFLSMIPRAEIAMSNEKTHELISIYQSSYLHGYNYFTKSSCSMADSKKMDNHWTQMLSQQRFEGTYVAREIFPGPPVPRGYFSQLIEKKVIHHLLIPFCPGLVRIKAQQHTGFQAMQQYTYCAHQDLRRWTTVPLLADPIRPELHGTFTYAHDKRGCFSCVSASSCGDASEVQ